MKTHYRLLGLDPAAPADEIKRAFRREIARYHPDKVQHLGPEFQEIAATRAAELTEAYRVLTDAASRRRYDDVLGTTSGYEAPGAPKPSYSTAAPAEFTARPGPSEPKAAPERVDRSFHEERATTSDVVRKAVIARLRVALGRMQPGAAQVPAAGFDAAYLIAPRRSLFGKAAPAVRLLARFVPRVDATAVEEAWTRATKSGPFDGVICLMLLGSGVSPAQELGAAIADLRRRTRAGAAVVVPVDVRDWEALFPPDAPALVRQVVQLLRDGS